ncbi:MAG: cell division protein FtsZ, partial [Cyclobacteriaceae bacterium]
HRARRAAEEALSSPLLDDKNIHGARKILLSIRSGEQAEMQMDELTEITEHIQNQAGEDAEMIFGHGLDDSLGEAIMVTVIATGFSMDDDDDNTEEENDKPSVIDLESEKPVKEKEPEPKNETAPAPPRANVPPATPPPPQPVQLEEEDDDEAYRQEKEEDERILREMSSSRRYLIMKEAYERRMKLKGRKSISSPDNNDDVFKKEDFFNEPAYLRRNVHLYNVPSYNDRNVSRYSLDDDDNIIGNNKFLHDNVD